MLPDTVQIINAINIVFRGIAVGIASSITVGPVAVLCIQRTLNKDRRSGLASGAGAACADTTMAVVAYYFYSMLQGQIEQYSSYLRIGGGICVVCFGIYLFLQNPVKQIRKNRAGRNSIIWQDFTSTFGFTIANFVIVIPYLLAFFAMFGVGNTEGDGRSLLTGALTIAGFLAGALAWWIFLTSAISLLGRRFRPRYMLVLNRASGTIIALLGLYTILSTFYTDLLNGLFH